MNAILKYSFSALFLLLMGCVAISCDHHRDPDEGRVVAYAPLKVDSFKINSDTMLVNSVQSIRTYFTLHSKCEGFYGYQFDKLGMERKVIPYYYKTDGNCSPQDKAYYTQFNFSPETSGIYEFKFWNGKDNAGNDVWIEKSIVVE
ncbi:MULTISPECIES: hypothetical protein [Amniculibacterium]|jgi:hypothetical protein|uniref:hypothetical protein n=1 Tax=Amniculibacterium TaxID=2715289 RepID=UPI000F58FF5D|nr:MULTISPECIES: hypothetical protein [Amniculibacterium]